MKMRSRNISTGNYLAFGDAIATPMQAISKMTGKIMNH